MGVPADGLYECMDFAEYFEAEGNHPFFIRVDGAIAGFVVVGRFPDIAGWNMEQFFILARFQRQGVGREAAALVWRRFPCPVARRGHPREPPRHPVLEERDRRGHGR
ncbi:MAG: hypothetical protein EXQ94_06585 [Alphaproteobacteria bacterium]|nr:hypothetical protein [Alphaproteobacteria bacterium]